MSAIGSSPSALVGAAALARSGPGTRDSRAGRWPTSTPLPGWARLPALTVASTSGARSTGRPSNSHTTDAATMPPYSWVRSNVPRGSSSSSRSLASVRIRSASCGDRFRPERTRGAAPDAVVDRRVEVRVERHRVQRRIGHRPVVALRQNRCGGQRSLRRHEGAVVDLQHLPDVGEPRQRVGVPLRRCSTPGVRRAAPGSTAADRPSPPDRTDRTRSPAQHWCVHCSGDGGRACRIESSQPSRSAGATLIQVTISAGGLSFHDG